MAHSNRNPYAPPVSIDGEYLIETSTGTAIVEAIGLVAEVSAFCGAALLFVAIAPVVYAVVVGYRLLKCWNSWAMEHYVIDRWLAGMIFVVSIYIVSMMVGTDA